MILTKRATWSKTKALYELPYQIMQLERDIEEKLDEIKEMRKKLEILKKEESPSYQSRN